MSTHRRLVAASPPWVAASLDGETRAVPVLHRGTDAVYLALPGTVLAVLSSSARVVPCGLRTTELHLPADVTSARRATVGAGRLSLGRTEVVATRFCDPTVPRRRDRDHGAARLRLAAAIDAAGASAQLAAVAHELPRAALERLAAGDPAAVPPLLGLGSGLTPVGDDVLCGALATLASADQLPPDLRITVLELGPGGTTALSATLLGCAVRGEVLPEFRRLVLDLEAPTAGGPQGRLAAAVADLLWVGHTSGAGLLLGATLALRHLASRSLTG